MKKISISPISGKIGVVMSIMECNLFIDEDESMVQYSAPYKKIIFHRHGLTGDFYIEVIKYNDPSNRIPVEDGHTLFFFDNDEREILQYWFNIIKPAIDK
jgi:hypothetical protein